MTSIRFSALHRPSMRTMWSLLSWYMISASRIISSFTSLSLSLFSTLMATSLWPLKGRLEACQGDNQTTQMCRCYGVSCFITFSSRFILEDAFLDAAEVPRAELQLVDQKLAPLDVELPHLVGVVVGVVLCVVIRIHCHRRLRGWLLSCRARLGPEAARGRCVAILSLRPLKYFAVDLRIKKIKISQASVIQWTNCNTHWLWKIGGLCNVIQTRNAF